MRIMIINEAIKKLEKAFSNENNKTDEEIAAEFMAVLEETINNSYDAGIKSRSKKSED